MTQLSNDLVLLNPVSILISFAIVVARRKDELGFDSLMCRLRFLHKRLEKRGQPSTVSNANAYDRYSVPEGAFQLENISWETA